MQLKLKLLDFNEKHLQDKKAKILNQIAHKSVKIFRQEITKRHLINTSNLIDSVGAKIFKNSVTIDIGADYASILNDGVRRHKMTYLVNKGPIPIKTNNGRLIFRVATNKNIKKDKWTHPGFKRGKGFFDVSVDKIEDACREIIFNEGIV
jgi:hypothetical protein